MKKIILIFIICIIPLLWNCSDHAKADISSNQTEITEDFRKALFDRFSSIDSLDLIFPYVRDNYDLIKNFYIGNEYQPVLIKPQESQKIVESILTYFIKASEHGINPEIYNIKVVKEELNKFQSNELNSSQRFYHLANTEIILVNSLINYSTHLRQGLVNPRNLYAPNYEIPTNKLSVFEKIEILRQNNILNYLESIQPKSQRYLLLQRALDKFQSISNLEWKIIPTPGKKIEPGNNYLHISQVIEKLIILGFIDSNSVKIKQSSKYDKNLIEPIKKFQKSHGLPEDGIIGKNTIERLNISPSKYVEKIKLNLERFRWNDYSDTIRFVMVNIPDFTLKVIENKKEILEIKVCTGRKVEWETPVLYSQISYLVLNPTWSVPQSIVEEEIINGLKKDSLYLKKRNFKAYKGGKLISLDELNIKELKTKKYTLIQDPGAGNALGKIKFMFDNPFGVYLHDTPTRAPFNYINRAVSHGCIRVEKPFVLAEYLLKNNSDWTVDYVKIETGYHVTDKNLINKFQSVRNQLRKNYSYGQTTEVRLFQTIPLFIDYFTAWVDEDGILNYRDDVYGKDILLKNNILF